jgi:hypothetical protein
MVLIDAMSRRPLKLAWVSPSPGLMATTMHCKKIYQFAQDKTISLTEKGSFSIRLMDFLMESSIFLQRGLSQR